MKHLMVEQNLFFICHRIVSWRVSLKLKGPWQDEKNELKMMSEAKSLTRPTNTGTCYKGDDKKGQPIHNSLCKQADETDIS